MSTTLREKTALVLGAGGLGGPALLVLASAGVGRLVIADDTVLQTSDLHRQPLFGEPDLGTRRSAAAAQRLVRQFPAVDVGVLDGPLDGGSATAAARFAQVVLVGTGSVSTHFLANDAALAAGIPLVHGGVLGYSAQLLTVLPGTTGCLRCLFEEPPPDGSIPTCVEAGVLGPLAGFAGALMGAEAVRLLAGERGTYAGQLVIYHSRSARSRTVQVRRREGCPSCSAAPPPAASTRPGVTPGG
jgi:molybdopterin/thiamine biosynthesis adenylyltransferase